MKKKILFFTNGLYGGGAEQILLTLLTHIDIHCSTLHYIV